MKLHELIVELQRLEQSEPGADLRLEWHEFDGNGTCSSEAGYVDAKIEDGRAVIRITEPIRVEAVRACGRDA